VSLSVLVVLPVTARAEIYCGFPEIQNSIVNPLMNPAMSVSSARPPSDSQLMSQTLPIIVHFPRAVDPTYALNILSYAEATWQRLFVEMGFRAPLADGEEGGNNFFDIYISTTLAPAYGGYAGFSGYDESTQISDAVGYLVINNNVDTRLVRGVVAHELFHVSQMAYDFFENISFMEATATWVVDHVFDDEDIYWRYFKFYNQKPYLALNFQLITDGYMYGSALYYQFLDEKYGNGDGTVIRKLWEGVEQNWTEPMMNNEPDFLDAIESQIQVGLDQSYQDFGLWRVLLGSRKENGLFNEVSIWDNTLDPKFENQNPHQKLGAYSNAYFSFLPDVKATEFKFTFTGDDQNRYTIDWLEIGKSKINYVQGIKFEGGHAFASTHQLVDIDAQEVVVIVSSLGDGNYDADTSLWTKSDFTWNFEQFERSDLGKAE